MTGTGTVSGAAEDAAGSAKQNTAVAAIVLAAGKSTRMRSKLPKMLHAVGGRPILVHILDALGMAGVPRRVVVVGHQADAVQDTLDAQIGSGVLEYALQSEQRGTGHAVQMAQNQLGNFAGTLLVVPGDTPLLSASVLNDLIAGHRMSGAAATVLTAILPHDAGAYGRVLRGKDNQVTGIVEARDASPEQKAVREINTSVYAFDAAHLFHALGDLRPDNAQGEYYLTDVIGLLRKAGLTVGAHVSPDPDIVLGVNTRVELAEIGEKMRARTLHALMLSGVTVVDPATTYVDATVTVEPDTTLLPGTHLSGQTQIGSDCTIGPNAQLTDCTVGQGVVVRHTVAERAIIGDGCRVGPFAHLRPGTVLGRAVKVGNFVETKAATLHDGVSAGHLTYLGDAEVGAHTNIGAGTITCNYDGVNKHRTTIGAHAFVGTHSTLVAPVTIADDGFTAAGSTITRDVPAGTLGVARERQTNIEGWVHRRRQKQAAQKEGTGTA